MSNFQPSFSARLQRLTDLCLNYLGSTRQLSNPFIQPHTTTEFCLFWILRHSPRISRTPLSITTSLWSRILTQHWLTTVRGFGIPCSPFDLHLAYVVALPQIAPKHGSCLIQPGIVSQKKHVQLAFECEYARSLRKLGMAVGHRFQVKRGSNPTCQSSFA